MSMHATLDSCFGNKMVEILGQFFKGILTDPVFCFFLTELKGA